MPSDLSALERAFATATPHLLRAARRELREHVAEDAVQDTLLSAWQRRARFDATRAGPSAWLHGILRRRVQDARRQMQRRPHSPLEVEPVDGAAAGDAVAARELAEHVRAQISALPLPFRTVVALHVEQGLAARDIALRLGIPEGTARSQLARGLAMLRPRLPRAVGAIALAVGRGRMALLPGLVASLPLAWGFAAALSCVALCVLAARSVWPARYDRDTAAPVSAPAAAPPLARAGEVRARREALAPSGAQAEPPSPVRRVRARYVLDGAPVADLALVVAAVANGPAPPTVGGVVAGGLPLAIRTSADGTAALPSLPEGVYEVRARRAPAWTRFSSRAASEPADIELAIPPGCWLAGEVLGVAAPAPATIALRVDQGMEEIVATTGADGRFVVRDVAAGRTLTLVARQGDASSAPLSVTGAVGERVSVTLHLRPFVPEARPAVADTTQGTAAPPLPLPPLAIDVRGPRGEALVSWRVVPGGDSAGAADHVAFTDAAGRALLPRGIDFVRVLPPADTYGDNPGLERREPAIVQRAVDRNAEALTLDVPDASMPTAAIVLPVRSTTSGIALLLDSAGAPRLRRRFTSSGADVTFAALPPGYWQPAMQVEGGPWHFLPPVEVSPRQTVTLPVWTPQPPGRVHIRVFAGSIEATSRTKLVVLAHEQPLLFDDRTWRQDSAIEVAPGSYEVLVGVEGNAPQRQQVEVVSGASRDLSFHLEPAAPCTLSVRGVVADAAAATMGLDVCVRRDREVVWRERRRFAPADPIVWPLHLPPGVLEIAVRDARGRLATGSVAIQAAEAGTVEVELR